MIKSVLAVALIGLSAAFSLPPEGDFHYTIEPRIAQEGQPVRFQARRFAMCLYSYDVTWSLHPTPISSKRTMLINLKATLKPQCATAAGYSGPMVEFHDLEPAAYRIQFDSASDFKQDLGDTNSFEVVNSLAIRPGPGMGGTRSGKEPPPGLRRFRVDGRMAESILAPTFYFSRPRQGSSRSSKP